MQDVNVSRKIYSTFAGVASSLGLSEVHGTVIGALLVANRPLALQDIAKKTGYSLSSVSISIDLLEILGIVRKHRNLGDRKVYVNLEGDLLASLKKAFLLKLQKEIFLTTAELEKFAATAADQNSKKAVKALQKETERLQKYISKLSEVELPR